MRYTEKEFVWKIGVLGMGLTCAVLANAFDLVFKGINDFSFLKLIISFIFWPVGGFIWGKAMYTYYLKKTNSTT